MKAEKIDSVTERSGAGKAGNVQPVSMQFGKQTDSPDRKRV